MALTSPGQYPSLSVLTDKEIDPDVTTVKATYYSPEFDSGAVSCDVLMSILHDGIILHNLMKSLTSLMLQKYMQVEITMVADL